MKTNFNCFNFKCLRIDSSVNNERLKCNENEFKCHYSNRCISLNFKCDCINDCKTNNDDLSDESLFNCNNDNYSYINGNNNRCNTVEINNDKYYCNKNTQIWCLDANTNFPVCKPINEKCNHVIDCSNEIDELNCNFKNSCTNVYRNDNYGFITSPNYPSKYDSLLNCSYRIIVEPYQKIQIRIKKLYLKTPATLMSQIQLLSSASYNTMNKKETNETSNKKTRISATKNSNIINKDENNDNYDYLSIYDGDSIYSPVLVQLNYENNMNEINSRQKIFNSKSNIIFIVFHTTKTANVISNANTNINNIYYGFNLTYQVKGLCIDDQQSCASYTYNNFYIKNELNCFDKEERCDYEWACYNGADEHDCDGCTNHQYKCRTHTTCYKYEDRCDGDYQCIDKVGFLYSLLKQ